MPRNRLNLSALRERSAQPALSETNGLSRRQFLGLAGTAAVSASAALSVGHAAWLGPFTLAVSAGRAAFSLGGRECWSIDVRRYAGTPHLCVEQGEDWIRLELTGARYPGTALPAALTCVLKRGLSGWRMTLKLGQGSLTGQARFERWLAGAEALFLTGSLRRSVVWSPASGSALMLGGRFNAEHRAEYRPDGILCLHGPAVAALTHGGAEFRADQCQLGLAGFEAASLLQRPPARRATLRLDRGAYAWPSAALLPPAPLGTFTGDDVFAALEIETGEGSRGGQRHALSAVSAGPDARLRFCASPEITGDSGDRAGIPLHMPLAAVAFDRAGHHTALTARYSPDPFWLRVGGRLMQLGPDPAPFEVTGRRGRLRSFDCAPALLAAAVPLPGAITEPVRFSGAPRLRFAVDGLRPAAPPRDSRPEATLALSKGRLGPLTSLPDFRVEVVRPDDLLVLRFEFSNLALDSTGAHLVIPAGSADPSYLIVHFPPQSVTEQTFFTTDPSFTFPTTDAPPISAPVGSRISGESRLVFQILASQTPIPYTLQSLLTVLSQSTMSVAPNAMPPGVDPGIASEDFLPGDPGKLSSPVTALEIPWRLVISPDATESWAHATNGPVTYQGRTELWHTRLATLGTSSFPPLEGKIHYSRAIWSPDCIWSPDYTGPQINPFTEPSSDPTYDNALDADDRSQLAGLMGSFISQPGEVSSSANRYMTVNQLMLTALGGYLNSVYEADPLLATDHGYDVGAWDHKATLGRDHYVRVVKKGSLFPFGHEAASVQVTTREFCRDASGTYYTACLVQRLYVLVKQPVLTYTDRRMPFRSLEITTVQTPPLDQPMPIPGIQASTNVFWPQVNTADFLFHLIGTDWDNNTAEFTAPLIFVDSTVTTFANSLQNPNDITNLKGVYKTDPRRIRGMSGQMIAFAPSAGAAPLSVPSHFPRSGAIPRKPHEAEQSAGSGVTSFPTQLIAFASDASQYDALGNLIPLPIFGGANIRIHSLEQITGQAQMSAGQLPAVQWLTQYLTSGFAAQQNPSETFLQLVSDATAVGAVPGVPDASNLASMGATFASNQVGGLATPNFSVAALSRMLGPAAINNTLPNQGILSGTFNPADYFAGIGSAKILGAIALSDIIGLTDLSQAPQILNETLAAIEALPERIQASLQWVTSTLKPDPFQIFVPNAGATLTLTAKITQAVPQLTNPNAPITAPTYDVTGTLTNFTLSLVGDFNVIQIAFNSITFEAASGKSVSVSPSISNVAFSGAMAFLQQLSQLIPTDGFAPAGFSLSPTGITANLSLSLPDVGAGIFSITNINFLASLTLPFTAGPLRLRFGFSSREQPFLVSVDLLAGGGYFLMAVGPDGVEMIEAGIDMGADASIDLGVASGNVYVLFGLAFSWDNVAKQATVTGYLSIGGSLSVLGLITVSVELYLGLSYCSDGTITGEASLTIEIDILFFSTSVTLDVKRSFTASSLSILSHAEHVSRWRTGPGVREKLQYSESGPKLLPTAFGAIVSSQNVWDTYTAAFASV